MQINENDFFKYNLSNSKLPSLVEECISVLEILDNNYSGLFPNINNKRTTLNCLPGSQASIYSLNGIIKLLKIGNIVDSFVLIRKIRDNLFLDLFLLSKDYNTRNVSSKRAKSKDGEPMSHEETKELAKLFLEMFEEDANIQRWFTDGYLPETAKKERKQIIGYGRFLEDVKQRKPALKKAYEMYFEIILNKIGNTLENFVHSNGFTVISNNILNKFPDRFNIFLEIIHSIVEDIVIVYLSTIILMNSTLIRSNNYTESIDEGIIPNEDSKYWVAPGVTDFLKKHVKKKHPNIFSFIKDNQEYSMDLSEI